MIQMNLLKKQKQTHRHRKQSCGYQVERVEGEIDWEFGRDECTPLHLK